ncbi:hypothetical protein DPMN_031454 [Dreissena polymorpha]|uniref:Uncharacterized protein n=1 Tax=Dreissena polymorpha TaxID=45954 RepID=A0A9D4M2D5_DREPO|nr:hypothetical protein DPMN_031454 [Dreissena polymorpha]
MIKGGRGGGRGGVIMWGGYNMFKKNWGGWGGVRGGNNGGIMWWGGDIMWVERGCGGREGQKLLQNVKVAAKPTNQQTNQQRGQKQNVPHYYRILLSSDNHLTDRPTDRPT